MSHLQIIKPECFSGEQDSVAVTDFLDTLELIFTCLDSIHDPVKRERVNVLALQVHLDGKAKQSWLFLQSDKKATFELASQALKWKFLMHENNLGDWKEKVKAVSEMNILIQGSLISAQYVRKANDLFNILGEEYSLVLATKFVDGIIDDNTKLMVDAQLDGAYNFPDVIKAYEKCTKFFHCREMTRQRPEPIKDLSAKTETEMMVEAMKQNSQAMKQNSQMVLQIGEMLKGLTLPKQQAERPSFGGRRYQPIVGIVGSTQGGQNNSEYQKPRPNYEDRLDVVCYNCGVHGHKVFECCSTNLLSQEEQDKRRGRYQQAGESKWPQDQAPSPTRSQAQDQSYQPVRSQGPRTQAVATYVK